MTPPDSNDDHLAELRRRWEEDPASRIFLQLAEEYRRAGRNEEALEVLEKGMESHPQQVSGLVSLGRIHLALDQPGEAAEALEKAVEIDPTNPMAMKLATEAHLQAGDRSLAKQRLDLYKLLNAGDEDTERLEARVEGREPVSPAPVEPEPTIPPPPGVADSPDAAEATGTATSTDDATPPGSWSPTAAWPGLPKNESGEPAGGEPPVQPSAAADAVTGGYASEFEKQDAPTDTDSTAVTDSTTTADTTPDDRPEPFADLWADGQEREYLSGLASEGIFPVEADAASDGDAAAEEEVATGDEPEPFPDLTTEVESDGGESPWDLVDHDAPVAQEQSASHERSASHEQSTSADEDALVVREETLPVAADETTPEATQDRGEEAEETGPRPTVTLGQLYLDQGHHDEALAIFEAILEREPDRQAAIDGRRAALHAQGADEDAAESGDAAPAPPLGFTLGADELLRGADPSQPPKVALLQAYLDRIRGERAS